MPCLRRDDVYHGEDRDSKKSVSFGIVSIKLDFASFSLRETDLKKARLSSRGAVEVTNDAVRVVSCYS